MGSQRRMAKTTHHNWVCTKLHEFLDAGQPGIEIDVGLSERWRRTCLTFRHASFEGLLAEQRFRRLMQQIPEEFYEKHLRGAVWLELAPEETVDDALRAPRSDDVVDAEPAIVERLQQIAFFEVLESTMGETPIESCGGDFALSRKVLADKGITGDEQRDACLVFIRHGAYCDCEVLLAARPSLASQDTGT